MVVGNEMKIFITLKNTTLAISMKNVTAANGDYLVYFHPLTIGSNILMRNGTYPLMFIGRVYNSYLMPNPVYTYNKPKISK